MAVKKNSLGDIIKIELNRDPEIITGDIIQREAPEERLANFNTVNVISPILNEAQLSILLNKTPEWAVKIRTGPGGKTYKYVPHGYVTDVMNKAFGFDWDLFIDDIGQGRKFELQLEEVLKPNGQILKTRRHLAICGHITVHAKDKDGNVHDIVKYGIGSQEWLPTMEFGDALKGARSDLVKVCAYQLGIALDLYWNERAEINEFENEVRAREDEVKSKERLKDLEKRGIPTSFAALLSKASTDYKYDGGDIEKILEVEITDLMDLSDDAFPSCWDKIVAHASLQNKKEE